MDLLGSPDNTLSSLEVYNKVRLTFQFATRRPRTEPLPDPPFRHFHSVCHSRHDSRPSRPTTRAMYFPYLSPQSQTTRLDLFVSDLPLSSDCYELRPSACLRKSSSLFHFPYIPSDALHSSPAPTARPGWSSVLPVLLNFHVAGKLDGLILTSAKELDGHIEARALEMYPRVFFPGVHLPPSSWLIGDEQRKTKDREPGEVTKFLDSALKTHGVKSVLLISFVALHFLQHSLRLERCVTN